MMTAPHTNLLQDVVVRLVGVCQDGEWLYARAARGVTDPMLRAELTQYSTQRREFIIELFEAMHTAGDAVHEVPLDLESASDRLVSAGVERDQAALLAECERAEAVAVEAYRQAVAADLPYVVGGVIHTQFVAIARVQDRIQTLAAAALGELA